MADFVISASLELKDSLTAPMRAAVQAIRRLRGEADDADDSVNNLNSTLLKGSKALGLVTSGFSTATAAIAPLIAGVGALGSSFAAAGIGAAAYGVVAKSALTSVFEASEEVAKLEEKIANADSAKERITAQKELNKLYADMSKGQQGALRNLQEFKGFWQGFTKQFETPVFAAFSESLKAAQGVLKGLEPTISAVANTVTTLTKEFNTALQGSGMKSFFDWLSTSASKSIYNFSHIFGNTLSGVMGTLRAFAPLGASVEEGLLGMTKRFREWAASLSESEGFKTFIEYAKTNWSSLFGTLGNLGKIIGNIGIALAPTGTVVLQALEKITGFAAKLSETFKSLATVIQPALTAVVSFVSTKLTELKVFWEQNGTQILQAAVNAWNAIKVVLIPIVTVLWNAIKGVISGALNAVQGILKVFAGVFTGDWSTAWQGIKQTVFGAIELIWNALTLTFFGRVLSAGKAFFASLKATFSGGWTTIKTKTVEMILAIKKNIDEFILDAKNIAMNFLKGIADGFIKNIAVVVSAAQSVWQAIKGVFTDDPITVTPTVRTAPAVTGMADFRKIDGSHANGLAYVPKDNYIARLHRGERVLTEDENEVYTKGIVNNRSTTTNNTTHNRPIEINLIYNGTSAKEEIDAAFAKFASDVKETLSNM